MSETDLPSATPLPDTPALKANAVGLPRVIAHTAAMIGPAASIALGLVAAISFAGYATPLVVLLSFIAAVCASAVVGQFAKRLPSAGSFFTYNSVALGQPTGFVTGNMMLFAYIIFVPAGAGAAAGFFSNFLTAAFKVHFSATWLVIIIMLGIMVLAYEGISTSASVDMIVLVFEMAVIIALVCAIFIEGGHGPSGYHLFDPSNTLHHHLSDLSLAMVYTVVIFTGFESGAVLGEEARNPRRTIPRGLLGAVVVVGLFYLFVSYGELAGVAHNTITKFAVSTNQLGFLTTRFWSSSVLWLIDLVISLSTLAFTIATFNSGARMLFAMGRERMLPRQLSLVSSRKTPHIAIFAITAFTMAVAAPITAAFGGYLTFEYLGGVAGIAFIIVYIALCVGMITIAFRQWNRERNIFTHIVVPVIAAGLFCIPLVGTFYPVPAAPYDYLPYIAVGWLVLSILAVLIIRRRRPALLSAIGRVFIESEPTKGQEPVALVVEPSPHRIET